MMLSNIKPRLRLPATKAIKLDDLAQPAVAYSDQEPEEIQSPQFGVHARGRHKKSTTYFSQISPKPVPEESSMRSSHSSFDKQSRVSNPSCLKQKNVNKSLNKSQIEVKEHFKQLQSIYGLQNQNLRSQKQYLIQIIKSKKLKEKENQKYIKQLQQEIKKLQNLNQTLEQQYEKIREQLTEELLRSEAKLDDSICFKGQDQENSRSTTLSHSGNLLEQLNEKFDTLMEQYQRTKDEKIRKQCINVAREIKKLQSTEGAI